MIQVEWSSFKCASCDWTAPSDATGETVRDHILTHYPKSLAACASPPKDDPLPDAIHIEHALNVIQNYAQERVRRTISGNDDGRKVDLLWDQVKHAIHDVAACASPQEKDKHIALLNTEIARHVEAASVFQSGGALAGVLRLGQSTVVDGMKWLLAERERLSARCASTEQRAAQLEAALDRTRVYIETAMRPISVKEACGETAWDRAHRSGLKHALNTIDAEFNKVKELATLRAEHEVEG